MATIGTFKKTGTNEFTGDIVTHGVQARGVRIIPDTRAVHDSHLERARWLAQTGYRDLLPHRVS